MTEQEIRLKFNDLTTEEAEALSWKEVLQRVLPEMREYGLSQEKSHERYYGYCLEERLIPVVERAIESSRDLVSQAETMIQRGEDPVKAYQSLGLNIPPKYQKRETSEEQKQQSKSGGKLMQLIPSTIKSALRRKDPEPLTISHSEALKQEEEMKIQKEKEMQKEKNPGQLTTYETDTDADDRSTLESAIASDDGYVSETAANKAREEIKIEQRNVEMDMIVEDGNFESKMSKHVLKVNDKLSYMGFDPRAMRDFCQKNMTFKQLVDCLLTYISCGNNYRKRLKRVKDRDFGSDIADKLQDWKFRTQRGESANSEIRTLSRVAVAHSPLLLKIRYLLYVKNELNAQTMGIDIAPFWCDLCLAGLPNKPSSYKDFYREMSIEFDMSKAREENRKEKSLEEIEEESKKWIRNAELGYSQDSYLHDHPGPRESWSVFRAFFKM